MKKKIFALAPFMLALLAAAQGPADVQNPAGGQNSSSASCPAATNPPIKCPAAVDAEAAATHGLVVARPKVYDDYYLRALLDNLKGRLASLNTFDQMTLLGHIGNVQGADLRQLSVGVSASGPPTPQVQTFTLAPGVPPPTTTTPGTQTTTNSVAPTAPTPPAPTLAIPGTQAVGSLDTLNEETQLAAEITNLQLLLDGSLSDKVQGNTGAAKATVTLGFPITIEPPTPADKHHQNRVAEVEVTMCTPKGDNDPPSIVTLLPQERTYNVAGLVDNSFSGSLSAVLGGVVNVGGGVFSSHKKYYLVQQQEMVALRRPPRSANEFGKGCAAGSGTKADTTTGTGTGTTTFAWQIHPVLNQKYVRPGMTQAFVQFSLPPARVITDPKKAEPRSFGKACVRVGWLDTEDNGNRISDKLQDEQVACFDVPLYSTKPEFDSVLVRDIGKGLVSVTVSSKKALLAGVAVQYGQATVVPDYSLADGETMLTFSAPAQDLVAAGSVWLVSRDGQRTQVLNSIHAKPQLTIDGTQLRITPYSDTQSLVRLRFTRPLGDTPTRIPAGDLIYTGWEPTNLLKINPYVAVIAGKVFGLTDNPFRSRTPEVNAQNVDISFTVPNDLLAASPHIALGRLLWGDDFNTDIVVPSSDFSVGNAALLYSSNGLSMVLTGIGLDNALLLYPPSCQALFEERNPSFAVLRVKEAAKDCPGSLDLKSLKRLVLCQEDTYYAKQNHGEHRCVTQVAPITVGIPKGEAPKPSVDKPDPIPPGTSRVEITGELLDQVAGVEMGKTPLTFRMSLAAKPSLVVDLPAAVANSSGVYTLTVTYSDKSNDTVKVTVRPAQR